MIVKADFGRDQYSIACGDFLYDDNCFTEVTPTVTNICGNKQSCDIMPSTQIFQNFCDGNTQLLRIWYQCVADGKRDNFFSCDYKYLSLIFK